MSFGSKKPKEYKVKVPAAPAQTAASVPTNQQPAALPVSSEIDTLRNQYSQQYSLLQQQSAAAEQAYQQKLQELQGQYNQQVGLLSNQLGTQQQQYSILQNQYLQAQENAKRQYEEQQKYYADLIKQQQEQFTREQEAARRQLMEAEQVQSQLQSDAVMSLSAATTSAKKKEPSNVAATNLATVIRGTPSFSLLRR